VFLKVLSGILPLTEATSSAVSGDKEEANDQPKEGSDLAEDESDSMHIDYPPWPPRDLVFNQGAARNIMLDLPPSDAPCMDAPQSTMAAPGHDLDLTFSTPPGTADLEPTSTMPGRDLNLNSSSVLGTAAALRPIPTTTRALIFPMLLVQLPFSQYPGCLDMTWILILPMPLVQPPFNQHPQCLDMVWILIFLMLLVPVLHGQHQQHLNLTQIFRRVLLVNIPVD
jgi:hypothetical protein